MKCQNCNEELENDIKTCSKCNQDLEELAPKNKNKLSQKNVKIIIVLVLIFFVLVAICLFMLLKDKKNHVTPSVPKTQEQLLNELGAKLEEKSLEHYKTENKMLSWNDLKVLVEGAQDIKCVGYHINYDATIYLKDCYTTDETKKYNYGVEKIKPSVNQKKLYIVKDEYDNYDFSNKKTNDVITCKTDKCEGLAIAKDYAVILDNGKGVIINYVTNKVLIDNLDITSADSVFIYNIDHNTGDYDTSLLGFVLRKTVNNEDTTGFFYIKGNKLTIPMEYDYIAMQYPDQNGVFGEKYTIVSKNEKQGVIDLTTGKVMVEVKYNDYIACDYIYCVLPEKDKVKLYNFIDKKFILNNKSYDAIELPRSQINYILAREKNEYAIYYLNGDKLITLATFTSEQSVHMRGYILDDNDKLKQIFVNIMKPGMDIGDGDGDNCIEYYYDFKTANIESKDNFCGGYGKPVLYLYPKEITNVTVSFANPRLLTTTYPKYTNKWQVVAHPNGDLYDKNNKYYYALYWEEEKNHEIDFKTGFYVTKANAIAFLEEKLKTLGFNDREKNEFIMYWLPILEKNEKSLVYFELTNERETFSKINISPKPDSLLRVAIHVKKVDKKIAIKEQYLPAFKRTGFVAVEWGGVIH